MAEIKLSKRMHAVADLVCEDSVCDIGCDHAHVSIWLANNGVTKVIAMDVKEGPLLIARENVKSYGLENVIDIRQSDGMAGLKQNEVSCAIIAGMGGELITDILERGCMHLRDGIHLILQPQSEIHKVREFLQKKGYAITAEAMLVEEGKYYNVIKALPDYEVEDTFKKDSYSQVEICYGRILLEEKNPVLRRYLTEQSKKLSSLEGRLKNVYTASSAHRLDMIKEEARLINEALDML